MWVIGREHQETLDIPRYVSAKKGHEVICGIWPGQVGEVEFYVSRDKLDYLLKSGLEHVYFGILSAAEVLKAPLAVYSGLQRQGQEAGLCYCGRPRRYREQSEMPGPSGYVFCVFVTANRLVYEWRWEKASEGDQDLPEGHDSGRFGELKQRYGNTIGSDPRP